MSLLEFQRCIAQCVSHPLTSEGDMQTTDADGASIDDIVANYVKPSDRLSCMERLEIYNRQYWLRLIGAVSEDYPALHAVLGQKRFDALILAYLIQNPSTSFTLRDLGAKLPAWLDDHPEFTGSRHDLAVDVARLEWAYIDAFDRATLPPLGTEGISQLLPVSVLGLQPHLQLLALRYAVDEIVLAVHKNAPDIDIVSNAVTARKNSPRVSLPKTKRAATYLAVHRYDNSVYYRRIDREAYLLLNALQQGEPIASAVDRAFTGCALLPSQQAEKVRETFAHASELGWFVAADRAEQGK